MTSAPDSRFGCHLGLAGTFGLDLIISLTGIYLQENRLESTLCLLQIKYLLEMFVYRAHPHS